MNDLTIKELTNIDAIRARILTIRGVQVMLASDLAMLYDVPTKRLNEQVKRNIERFPERFMFRLTSEDVANLRSQFATSNPDAGSYDSVLRSQFAVVPNYLGKKCFAFSSLDKSNIPDILAKI